MPRREFCAPLYAVTGWVFAPHYFIQIIRDLMEVSWCGDKLWCKLMVPFVLPPAPLGGVSGAF